MTKTTLSCLVLACCLCMLLHSLQHQMVSAKMIIPTVFPEFKSCDLSWAQASLPSGSTMCRDGSAWTALAMALAGRGISFNDAPATPSALLPFIQGKSLSRTFHSLTSQRSDILYMGRHDPKPHYLDIVDGLKRGAVFLATVNAEKRTVLLTGWDDSLNKKFAMLDPTSEQLEIHYDDLTDLHVFWIGEEQIAHATRRPKHS